MAFGGRLTGEPRLVLIGLRDLDKVLPVISPMLIKVAARTQGDITFAGMVKRVQTAEEQLWLVGDDEKVLACVGTQIYFRDDGQKGFRVTFLSGSGMKAWLHLLDELERWAVERDCICSVITARQGFSRLLTGYRAYHIELEKDLRQ